MFGSGSGFLDDLIRIRSSRGADPDMDRDLPYPQPMANINSETVRCKSFCCPIFGYKASLRFACLCNR